MRAVTFDAIIKFSAMIGASNRNIHNDHINDRNTTTTTSSNGHFNSVGIDNDNTRPSSLIKLK